MLNFIGPDDGEGIRIYNDGVQVAEVTRKGYQPCTQDQTCMPDGTIVVGRLETGRHRDYCSLKMDELAFFNEALSQEEIAMLSQQFDNKYIFSLRNLDNNTKINCKVFI